MSTTEQETVTDNAEQPKRRALEFDVKDTFSLPSKYATLNRLITRDLNNYTSTPSFSLYSKDEINSYLSDPYTYEEEIRNAVIYMYGASSHFRRLIQYFAGLSDLAYVISPYNIDTKTANKDSIEAEYRSVLRMVSSMNIKTQFPKILTVCLREDTFYGTLWVTDDSITVQQLPSDYCSISVVEGNVPNVTFDFSYFDSRSDLLEYYPDEFNTKYNTYLSNRTDKWVELDSPTSFAIKASSDILAYSLPPFAGILREVYNLEDYKQLKLEQTEMENYAMLVMNLPMTDSGEWALDLPRAKEFWKNLDNVLPDEIGSVLSPMKIDKIGFDTQSTGDLNTISYAEQNLYTAAGVSSLLFNNEKASANALALSIKADQSITYSIVKSIEDMVNRYIQYQSYGSNFKVSFLDCSPYNRSELGDAYLKAASYGFPTISMYAATQGLGQAEIDNMSYLESTVLGLQDMFVAIRSSTQMSSDEIDESSEGGRPVEDDTSLTDSGEQSREQGDDWG